MPLSLLVVDDDSYVREALAVLISVDERLILAGTAVHGRDAVEQARLRCPDAILCDVNMPVMTGLEAAPLLRQACPAAAIVMFSAEPEAAAEAVAKGADAVVDKAEDASSLLDVVVHVCRSRDVP